MALNAGLVFRHSADRMYTIYSYVCSDEQEILDLLTNSNIHCCVHKRPHFDPLLSQDRIHAVTLLVCKSCRSALIFSRPRLGLTVVFFSSIFYKTNFKHLYHPSHTCSKPC